MRTLAGGPDSRRARLRRYSLHPDPGLARCEDPVRIERDLSVSLPRARETGANHSDPPPPDAFRSIASRFYEMDQIEEALADSKSGKVIKPILRISH